MKHLMIVDAEEDLLWALSKNLFKGRDDISVKTASSGDDALKQLESGRCDLLVTDTRVGGATDGFSLILQAKEMVPKAKLVVMTAFNTDDESAFEPSLGVAHFINKPFDIGELHELLSALLEDAEVARGKLGDLSLADILALLCLSGRTVLLHLNHKGRRGRFEVRGGTIVHAEFDGRSGPEAAWTMLGLAQGDIFMQGDFHPNTPSIGDSWQTLLSQAGSWLEEHGPAFEEEPEEDPAVEIPIEGWDDEDIDIDTDAPGMNPAMENPLGFSADELAEMAIDAAELPAETPPPDPAATYIPHEDTLPRAPMLRPSGHSGMRPLPTAAPAPRPSLNPGTAAMSLDEVVTTMVEEIPELVAVDIISLREGVCVAGALADDDSDYDRATASAYLSNVLDALQKAAGAFSGADSDAMQISTRDHYLLARLVPKSDFAQLVIMGRGGSLGIARVVMRRAQASIAASIAGDD